MRSLSSLALRLPFSSLALALTLTLPLSMGTPPSAHAATVEVNPALPLPLRLESSATTRRALKPALSSRPLHTPNDHTPWQHFGPGTLSFTTRDPHPVIRLESPTRLDRPGPVLGRPFAETGARLIVPGENWFSSQRLSFRVFPDMPGFRHPSLLVKFHATGSERWSYTFGQLHYVLLREGEWNEVSWEIDHLPRTNVTAIEFTYRLQGNEAVAPDQVRFDFRDVRLESIAQPDPYRGWEVAPGFLAYNHLGYTPDASKVALASADTSDTFFLAAADQPEVPLFQSNASLITHDIGRYRTLDFSAFRQTGIFILRHGPLTTPPFPIGTNLWLPALEATLNQYRCQRCGTAVPGVHDACHLDWMVAHGDLRLPIHGGWHDAGDLSQGLVNTAEATSALFAAAQTYATSSPILAHHFLAEARWGLDWVQRTRFGDGYRAVWATMDFWTDGLIGTADDATAKANNPAFDNFIAALTSARGARLLQPIDPIASSHALRLATDDCRFAFSKADTSRVDIASAAIRALVERHHAQPEPALLEHAVQLARTLTAAQQRTPPAGWSLPLSGFFYESTARTRTYRFNHRGHDESPVLALVALAEALPNHPDRPAWQEALRLHGRYLQHTAALNAPWDVPCACIYRLDEGDAAFQRQVRQGLRLDDQTYLRRFPVWGDLRGNSGILLSQAHALAAAARHLSDPDLAHLARRQLEWHLGRNPFAQSLMFGVGHNFTPQYTAMSGNITGGLPVGIQTRLDEDVPYWPVANCYNYAEIWIHPSTRFLDVLTELERAERP